MKKWLSLICIIALLVTLLPTYSLPANANSDEETKENEWDMISVSFPELPYYDGRNVTITPVVTMGDMVLKEGEHYTLTCEKTETVGTEGRVTVIGKGIYQGFEKTFYFPVLKTDALNAKVSDAHEILSFVGMPVGPSMSARGKEGIDYEIIYENNINIGTGTVRFVGKGGLYGEYIQNFKIVAVAEPLRLSANYIGTVGGELSEDYYIGEAIITPAEVMFYTDVSGLHQVAYALYKVAEDDVVLVEEKITDVGYSESTDYKYDFSFIYEGAADIGGEIYMLSYSWVTASGAIYAGAMFLAVPAKVGAATSMTLHHIEDDGDFRKEYFSVSGDDGVLEDVTWTSSDTSVAVVEGGTVTMKKPGTVRITAQCGDMIQSYELTETTQDLTQGIIFDYSEETGTARVIHDDRVLTEGTEYILSVEKNEGAVTVTATGCGFFTGELVKTFDGLDSLADPHTHSFTNSCDGTCNGCDFTRENDHNFSQNWSKDETHHWHVCLACGEKAEYTEHDLLSEEECSVCGALCSPGDVNGDDKVNSLDGLMLMRYLNGWGVEIAFPDAMDVNGDGKVNSLDGLILMRYLNGWNVSIG